MCSERVNESSTGYYFFLSSEESQTEYKTSEYLIFLDSAHPESVRRQELFRENLSIILTGEKKF